MPALSAPTPPAHLPCPRRRRLVQGAAALLTTAGTRAGGAPAFPVRRIELTVPFPPGSSADLVARLLAPGLARPLGQAVLVVNRPGAGGAIGYRHVQQAAPDGYSLLCTSNGMAPGPEGFDHGGLDRVARTTLENPVVAVMAEAPWADLKQLVAHAAAHPGTLRVGDSGVGSHTHAASVAFFEARRVDALHVPFGGMQMLPMLLGGHLDAVVQLPAAVVPLLSAGRVRLLGVMSPHRDPFSPGTPTTGEQGFPFHAQLWRGIEAPRGTPAAVLARLEHAVREAVAEPAFLRAGPCQGFVPAFLTRAAFTRSLAANDANALRRGGWRDSTTPAAP